MKSRLNNKNSVYKNISIVAVVVLLLLGVLYKTEVSHILATPIMGVNNLMLSVSVKTKEWFNKNIAYLKSKKELDETNQKLSEENSTLRIESTDNNVLRKENEELKKLLGRSEELGKKFIVAQITKRSPETPFDTMIIDAGEKNGVKNGATVSLEGKILLGYVVEVFGGSSKVEMISSSGKEIKILIGENSIAATAKGKGGGNLEALIPKETEIKEQDVVRTPGFDYLIIGAVEKIETDPSDPFQKVIFRIPANLSQISYVAVEK